MLRNEKYVGDLLLQKTYIVDTISKKAKKNDGELPKYLISNNHPAIVDRDTFNRVQAEYASRNNRVKRSETTIQAQGRYCSKYALSEVLTCGCCGSYYRRTYKMAHGKEQRVWRCIGRIEHRCTEAIGVHENKLQEAVCRCLSSMMQNSDEVLELCKQNLQYAFTGDQSALDTVALENQIRLIQDDIDMLMMSAEKTTGDPNKYEKEIIKKYEEIGILREQLKSAQAQAIQNNEVASEIENFIKDMESYEKTPITEFNDVMVRRLVENIRVMPNHKIVVVLRGGMQREEPI